MERTPMTERISREALEWHALQRQGGLGATDQARFMDWLVSSPEHLRNYLAVGRLAADLAEAMRATPLDQAEADAPAAGATPSNVIAWPIKRARVASASPSPRRSVRLRHLAAAAGLLLVLGAAARIAIPHSERYVAAHGEPRSIELPDGTVVHLNAESSLRIQFGLTGRRVELERGQASFVVADEYRPLSVHAAGLQVRDIGTTFDVSLQREQARIGVAEGRVQVIGDDGDGGLLADLRAGQGARIAYRDHAVSISDEDVDTMTAWWTRRIVFRNESLRDVADQFNRINTVRLDVDEAAGTLRLTGNLRGDDLASMRAFLDEQPTLVTQASSAGIRVSVRAEQGGGASPH
ncbi:FecR domain-containing protein [Lysobacter sp. MMG2]|uniref:FecR family protein n=1 Tax=Lysobacter sp. MMG2 TaxID=2801338 RepID=UPI001C219DA0|nr:FecR domain-containing protein [Lysobacter sp. MMG2]MBU8978021.1 FecR domain-containing protein [Lysobacter sp. MMG2]